MRLLALIAAMIGVCTSIHAAEPTPLAERSLLLAGGSLRVCSDLALRSCTRAPDDTHKARQPARFAITPLGVETVADPGLWQGSEDQARRLAEWVQAAGRRTESALLEAGAMEAALDAICVDARGRSSRCRRGQESPWRSLDDASRAALLAALEQPQAGDRRERAFPELSPPEAGIEVLRGFVTEAARRTGAAPRIAVVTASALDPFEAVDFYLSVFEALGARAEWWPLDAALARHLESGASCDLLEQSRRSEMRLPNREAIHPRLAARQRHACAAPESLAAVPDEVQGVFFSGGDQWRLRQAFHATDGSALPWLLHLRAAQAAGRLVVGGTSAGAAVQSAAAMLSNGSPEAALAGPGVAAEPPDPGCARAGTCPAGLQGDSFTYWPQGGLALARHAVVDTHFSERAREPRLLRLLDDSGAKLGYGVDEGSALLLRERGDQASVEAVGQHGGWVFLHRPAPSAGGLAAEAWYLASGSRLQLSFDADGTAHVEAQWTQACEDGEAIRTPGDALQRGALRMAGTALARCGQEAIELGAGTGDIRLSRERGTRIDPQQARPSIGPLRMEYRPH